MEQEKKVMMDSWKGEAGKSSVCGGGGVGRRNGSGS